MEYMFDFSKEGEKKFYSWVKEKRKEINNLIKDADEKSALLNIVDDNIRIYEKERIYQTNLVLEMVKNHNYSPKEAYDFIKKIKLQKLNQLQNESSEIKNLTLRN